MLSLKKSQQFKKSLEFTIDPKIALESSYGKYN